MIKKSYMRKIILERVELLRELQQDLEITDNINSLLKECKELLAKMEDK